VPPYTIIGAAYLLISLLHIKPENWRSSIAFMFREEVHAIDNEINSRSFRAARHRYAMPSCSLCRFAGHQDGRLGLAGRQTRLGDEQAHVFHDRFAEK